MKKYFDEFRQLYQSEKYKDALSVLDEIEKQDFVHPTILVWKSRCLQLTDDLSLVNLSEIEDLLKEALTLDDEYLPALSDLAYFYLRIMDDAQKAEPLFRKAFDLCLDNATEIVIGLGECIAETKSPEVALEFLAKSEKLELDAKKVKMLKIELEQS